MAEKKKSTTKTKKVVKKSSKIKNTWKKFVEFVKKYKVILIIIVVATILNILVVYAGVKDSTNKSDSGKITAGYVHYWIEQSKQDGALVTVFCQDGKKYCTEYEPIVRQIATDYNLPIYWVDLGSITDVEFQELIGTYEDLGNIKIPYTFITQKGKKVSGIEGSLDSESLLKALKEIGLIEEK